MMSRVNYLWPLFCVLLGVASATAQERLVEFEEPMKAFRVIGYGDDFFDGIYFERLEEDEVVKQAVRFYPDRISLIYRVAGTEKELRFFSDRVGKDGKQQQLLRGRLRLPNDSKGPFLLLFREGAQFETDGIYAIELIDESETNWGAGCFRFLNLSGTVLYCRIGDQAGRMDEGLSEVVRFPIEDWKPMKLQFGLDQAGGRKVIYSTETMPDSNYGKFLVIKPPLESRSLRIRVIEVW